MGALTILFVCIAFYGLARRENDNQIRQQSILRKPDEPSILSLDSLVVNAHRLLRKVESVILRRTGRVILIIEKLDEDEQHIACMRVAECFGVQNVWIIDSSSRKQDNSKTRKRLKYKATKKCREAADWLDVRYFSSVNACLETLKKDERTLWMLQSCRRGGSESVWTIKTIPPKLALFVARTDHRESSRRSFKTNQEMTAFADSFFYFPLSGFTPCLSLAPLTAVVLDVFFTVCPSMRGELSEIQRAALRIRWYEKVARNDSQRKEFSSLVKPPDKSDKGNTKSQKKVIPFDDLRAPDEMLPSWARRKRYEALS